MEFFNLLAAAQEYRRRKERDSHPDGTFDTAGRWWPSSLEEQGCCGGIRDPSRSHPYGLMVHCRSARHVAQLYQVPEADLAALLRRLK